LVEYVRWVDCDGSGCQVGLFGIKVNRRVKGFLNSSEAGTHRKWGRFKRPPSGSRRDCRW
jgi:hypothetical protein